MNRLIYNVDNFTVIVCRAEIMECILFGEHCKECKEYIFFFNQWAIVLDTVNNLKMKYS